MSDNSASIVKDEKKQLGKFDTTRDKIIIDMGADGISYLRFDSVEKNIIDQSGNVFKKK